MQWLTSCVCKPRASPDAGTGADVGVASIRSALMRSVACWGSHQTALLVLGGSPSKRIVQVSPARGDVDTTWVVGIEDEHVTLAAAASIGSAPSTMSWEDLRARGRGRVPERVTSTSSSSGSPSLRT